MNWKGAKRTLIIAVASIAIVAGIAWATLSNPQPSVGLYFTSNSDPTTGAGVAAPSEVQIFNMAQAGGTPAARAAAPRQTAPARRPGMVGLPGGGGMTIDLGSLRPTPVRPPGAPATPDMAIDDARQRFALLELDGEAEEAVQSAGGEARNNDNQKTG